MSRKRHSRKAARVGAAKRRKTAISHLVRVPEQIYVGGKKRHSKKAKRHSRRGMLMGGSGGALVNRIGSNAIEAAAGVAGMVAASYAGSMIPVTNAKVKNAILAAAGLALASSFRSQAIKMAGMGVAMIGTYSFARSFGLPIPALSGHISFPAAAAPMGIPFNPALGIPVHTGAPAMGFEPYRVQGD